MSHPSVGKTRNSHLQGSRGTQVRLENILETLSSADVDLQGLSTSLNEMLVRATEGSYRGAAFHTRDSALGLSSWVADISAVKMNDRELSPREKS
jgi:hypothetical protein